MANRRQPGCSARPGSTAQLIQRLLWRRLPELETAGGLDLDEDDAWCSDMFMERDAAWDGDEEGRTEYARLKARLDEPVHAAARVTGRQHAYVKLCEKVRHSSALRVRVRVT